MKSVAVFLPNGYEEMEALCVVDLLRRAEIPVELLSVTGTLQTQGDHQISILADRLIEDATIEDYQMVVTPGGYPGSRMLSAHETVCTWIQTFANDPNRWVACICASPMVLHAAGISSNYTGTCYPGVQDQVQFGTYDPHSLVVQDRNLITSQGPGTAVLFALKIVEVLKGTDTRQNLEKQLLWDRVLSQ